jgi:hypothetical protein
MSVGIGIIAAVIIGVLGAIWVFTWLMKRRRR